MALNKSTSRVSSFNRVSSNNIAPPGPLGAAMGGLTKAGAEAIAQDVVDTDLSALKASEIANDSTVVGSKISDALDTLKGDITPSESSHTTLEPYAYSAQVGDWKLYTTTSQINNMYIENYNAAQNDHIDYRHFLSEGTHTLRIVAWGDDYCGIITAYWNNISQGTFDNYRAATTYNIVGDITITVSAANAGWQTLKLSIDTKNASSSDYDVSISGISIWKNA